MEKVMKKKAVEYSLKAQKQEFPIAKIRCATDAVNFARQFYYDDITIYESAFIILMNNAGNAMGYAKISQGGICGTIVDVRIVAKYAVETLASSVILVHNHPSGNVTPSNDDKELVKRLHQALMVLNVKFYDSIIITEDSYLSMRDEGICL